MGTLIGLIATAVLAGISGSVGRKLMRARHDRAGEFEVALRVVEGAAEGLAAKWTHGKVTIAPRTLTFHRGGPLGLRIPRTGTFVLLVTSVAVHDDRHPSLKEVWSISPSLRIGTVTIPGAQLDLAARPDQLEQIIAGLTSP